MSIPSIFYSYWGQATEFLASIMSSKLLFFNTGQVIFTILGAYGIYKIRERRIGQTSGVEP